MPNNANSINAANDITAANNANAVTAADTVTVEMVLDAYEKNRPHVKRTPLLRSELLEELFGGAEIYLKAENLQYTGSFKVRGVTNKMLSLSKDELARGVAAASSGNHAQAVAYMASKLGASAVIVMPTNAPVSKIEGTKKYGAKIVLHGLTGEEREIKCDELVREYGYSLVHPFADTLLIAGHGTLAVEAAEQIREIAGKDFDEIVIPCGAGSIVSGIGVAAKRYMSGTVVTAVEPSAVPRFTVSFKENRPVTVEMGNTIADGLRVGRAEPINYSLIREYADNLLTVDDTSIRRATREIITRGKIVAEPSAAVGIAAALDGKIDTSAGRRICFVISGGNMDAATLADILNG